jgi:hypothetical protein
MATFEVEDPVLYEEKKVDSSGKIYVGRKYSGMKARLLIERFEEIEENDDDE